MIEVNHPNTNSTTLLKKTPLSLAHTFTHVDAQEPRMKHRTSFGVVLQFLRKTRNGGTISKKRPIATASTLVIESMEFTDEVKKSSKTDPKSNWRI